MSVTYKRNTNYQFFDFLCVHLLALSDNFCTWFFYYSCPTLSAFSMETLELQSLLGD